MSKKYGLIKPGEAKKTQSVFTRPSIFGNESSDEEEAPRKIGLTSEMQKRQAKVLQDKALEEDPTVYQYDEVYDEISAKKQEEKAKKSQDKKPKYIESLLKTAERRKIENERRVERQVQKEREAEGEMFKDKEAFVTSSYRKKLEELKKIEEEEAREAYLESIGDVRKQGNLDGFYRHIYSQKLDKDKVVPQKPEIPKQGPVSATADDAEDDSDETRDTSVLDKNDTKSKKDSKPRSYRKRKQVDNENLGNESDEEKPSETKKQHLVNNLDADSDFSIDSSSSSSDEDEGKGEGKKEKVATQIKHEKADSPEFVRPSTSTVTLTQTLDSVKIESVEKDSSATMKEEELPQPVKLEPKPKIDIWKKRTVGEVFDAAVKRYYERKALRVQMSRQIKAN